MQAPPHPGPFIRTEILDPLTLDVSAAAAVLEVTRPTLSKLLNGRADLSPEMALRLEQAFGVSMDTLLRMQIAYDIAQTRATTRLSLRRYRGGRRAGRTLREARS
jgi:addiction module HigA family antidote